MGLTVSFISLLTGAAFCFSLAQIGITRRLAFLAALVTGLATLGVVLDPVTITPVEPFFTIGAVPVVLPTPPDLSERIFAIALLFAGTIGFLALALSVSADAEGFGALFGWLLLALSAALLSLTIPPLSFLTPLSWAVAVIATHGALVASGVDPKPNQLPPHLVGGGIAFVTGAGLVVSTALVPADILPPTVLVGLTLLGALALAGAPPFHGARRAFVTAPALIGALGAGLILPTIGLGFIVRALLQLPPLPASTSHILVTIGAFGALGAAFGALNAASGRELVHWQGALQAGVIICAAALNYPLASLAAAALFPALQLHAIAGGLVGAAIERQQGSDLLDGTQPTIRLPLIGFLWLVTTAIATGLPFVWSFWGWRWLIEAATIDYGWVIGPLLAAAVLGFASGLPLLFRCWQGRQTTTRFWPEGWLGTLILAPLILIGLAPWLAWPLWLSWASFAPPALPAEPVAWPLIGLTVLLGVVCWFLLRQDNPYQTARVEDPAVTPTWQGMGELLYGLSEVADARTTLSLISRGLDWIASLFHTVMIIFEQRYYLFGVMVALLAILILMAQ
ncbi:hypothetical protein [Chloroflexus sp. MS-G]|jgi:hypothetical protein|uniref:hypothetical protein n=1 Tax=Chloroflexus sp. MS-G TaxID=1521187 RepID=UPI0004DF9512|nr:hypothetical protein [Chloroflexus sp. MS-G]MBO9346906.1 hypothetical protein [Chloroflexus sp.]